MGEGSPVAAVERSSPLPWGEGQGEGMCALYGSPASDHKPAAAHAQELSGPFFRSTKCIAGEFLRPGVNVIRMGYIFTYSVGESGNASWQKNTINPPKSQGIRSARCRPCRCPVSNLPNSSRRTCCAPSSSAAKSCARWSRTRTSATAPSPSWAALPMRRSCSDPSRNTG